MSKTLKPWAQYPFELIRHAEGHLRNGTDFDRRMALISYDNSIEMSISTHLSIHPDLREGVEYKNEDVARWTRGYHPKLDFLVQFLSQHGLPEVVPKDELIYFHKLRNDLYHEGRGLVPSLDDLDGIRKAAVWVFEVLFKVNVEKLLTDTPITDKGSSPTTVSSETAFLGTMVEMQKKLDWLVRTIDTTSIDPNLDAPTAWQRVSRELGASSVRFEGLITEASRAKDAIIRGETVPVDTLKRLSRDIQAASVPLEEKLREYQRIVVANAIAATEMASASTADRRAGVVIQAVGTGLTATMTAYVRQLLSRGSFKDSIIVVVSERVMLAEQAYHVYRSEEELGSNTATIAASTEELKSLLDKGHNRVVFTTLQKLPGNADYIAPRDYINGRTDIVIVGYDLLSTRQQMSNLIATLPNATRILFGGAHLETVPGIFDAFGNVIASFNIEDTTKAGLALPVSYEFRQLASLSDLKPGTTHDQPEDDSGTTQRKFYDDALLKAIAGDIVRHFESRLKSTNAKALALVRNSRDAVCIFEEIVHLRPSWYDLEPSKNLVKIALRRKHDDGPNEWKYSSNSQEIDELAEQFRFADSSLRLLITAGLWFTGAPFPALNTVYLCRKMTPTGIMQLHGNLARVYAGKGDPVVVDYFGNPLIAQKSDLSLTE